MFFRKSNLIQCSKCGHKISKSARVCPDCGHPVGVLGWVLESKILLLLTGLLGFLGVNGVWFLDLFGLKQKHPNQQRPPTEINKPYHPGSSNNPVYTGAMKQCPVCRGSGQARCPDCGHGSAEPGLLSCVACQATGFTRCNSCSGTGRVDHYNFEKNRNELAECKQCKGKGQKRCERCAGKGHYRCQNCSKGFVSCTTCMGQGKIPLK